MKFSNRNNIRARQIKGWLFAAVFAVLAVLVVLRTGQVERASGEQQLQARMQGRTLANAEILNRQLQDLRRDALFIRSVPPVDGVVRAAANGGYDQAELTSGVLWEKRLSSIFRSYLQANPDAFQVRLIGSAGHGRELIRVERDQERIVSVPPERLQAQGDTRYVRDGLQLGQGQTYISDLNLNREQGTLQQPDIPTMHVIAPVYGMDGKIFGLVVINYDLRGVLRSLYGNLPTYFGAYLVNGKSISCCIRMRAVALVSNVASAGVGPMNSAAPMLPTACNDCSRRQGTIMRLPVKSCLIRYSGSSTSRMY